MAIFRGVARGRVDYSLGAQQAISLSTTNAAPNTQSSDRATWELNAGASITLFLNWVDGNPTGTNNMNLWLYYETGTGTLIRQLLSGGMPANGTSYTFFATTNGLSGGTPIAGSLRLRCQWIRTGTVGGLNDFNIDSDGGSSPPSLGSVVYQDQGLLRCNLIKKVAATQLLNINAYPSGSTFAIGTAATENVIPSADYTGVPTFRGHEKLQLNVLDGTSTFIAGTVRDANTGGTINETYAASVANFTDTAKSYGAELIPSGNSLIIPTSGAVLWTVCKAVAANDEQNGNNVRRQGYFNVDPRVTLANVAFGRALRNRGETPPITYNIRNARNENLTRSTTKVLKDSLGNTKSSAAGTGPSYTINYLIGPTDDAVSNTTGKQWTLETQNAEYTTVSANVYRVSSLRVIHSAAGLGDANNANNTLASSATATSDDGGGGDRSLVNVLETVDLSYYLYHADATPWTLGFDSKVIADNGTEEDSQSETADGAGLVELSYTVANGDQSTNDTVGSPKHVRVSSSDGNDTVNADDSWNVSRKIMLGSSVGTDDAAITVRVGTIGSGDDGTMGGVFPVAIFNRGSFEDDVALQTFISYARGTPYANHSVTSEVEDDTDTVEDSQSIVLTAGGQLDEIYTIANTDKATAHVNKDTGGYSALPTGSPKHLVATRGDNLTQDSDESWGVTKHLWVDVHDQREPPLVRDIWDNTAPLDGSENDAEETIGYVLLGNVLNLWAHVMGVRLDRNIETWDGDTGVYPTNRAVRLSTIKPAGSTHASFITDTALDGWTAGNDEDEDGELDGPDDPVAHEETYEQFEQATDTVVVTGVDAIKGNRYVVFVATNAATPPSVQSISGMGLDWQLQEAQDSSNAGDGRLECWIGEGEWTQEEDVTVTLTANADNVAVTILRYSGSDLSDPVQDSDKAEAAGGGSGTFALPSIVGTAGESIFIAGINANDQGGVTFTTPNNERSDHPAPGPGHDVALAVADTQANASNIATGSIDGGNTDWQGIALTLRPGNPVDPNSGQNFNSPWVQQTGSMAPASPNWQARAEVDFDGCSGQASDLINIITPLDSDKDIRLWVKVLAKPGQTLRLYAQIKQQAIADGETFKTFQPAVPDTLPKIRIGRILPGSPDSVDDNIASRPADEEGQDMLNAVDGTATINGSLYYYDFSYTLEDGINAWVFAQIGGAPVPRDATIRIADNALQFTGLPFAGPD